MKNKRIIYIFVIALLSTTLFSKTLFTYYENGEAKAGEDPYGYKLLKLSLEKTKNKYGDFELVRSPRSCAKLCLFNV